MLLATDAAPAAPFLCSPRDQVAGDSICAVLDAFRLFRRRAVQLLEEQGISEPKPGVWYPWQPYLNMLWDLYGRVGSAPVLMAGKRLVETNPFDEGTRTLIDALSTLDRDYRRRHRGTTIGAFVWTPTSAHSGIVSVTTPYPCELDRGVIEALCRRFRPDDSLTVRIEHPDHQCRKHGASACDFSVDWANRI